MADAALALVVLAASALESVDASMEESAQILGAGRWRTALPVTAPLVAPAVLSGALVAFVNAIALFGSQAIVGLPGRVFTLPTRIYALFDYPPQYGLASALSLIFVGLTVNLTLQHYRFVLLECDVTRRAIVNSLILASGTATLAVLIGSFGGWLDLRTALRERKLLDYASLVPLGLPGIVVAVALIQFWLRVPLPIYGTLLIILLAYTGRFIPLGVRSANAAFRQIDPSLEETTRVTGAGWLLVFVPALQELSASVLLFSSGSITLAVAVYNLYETGALGPVAALAIVTMLIITGAIVLATRLGRGTAVARAERPGVAQ
jgi:ABC-type Fe3+ transport system permease subunit